MASLAGVDDVAGAAAAPHIRNCLDTQSCHVRKYIVSAGQVFPGWIGFSQWYRRESGNYPPREMSVELGRMSKAEREDHTWFGLHLWETRKQKVR